MKQFFASIKRVLWEIISSPQPNAHIEPKTDLFYIRFWSEKDKKATERLAKGEPVAKKEGSQFLYIDVLRGNVIRSFKACNLLEKKQLDRQQAEFYKQHLTLS